jgi:hypothetical protein
MIDLKDHYHLKGNFRMKFKSILINITGHKYSDNNHFDDASEIASESNLTLHIEPEKTKTFKYVECGELSGEKIYKKVEE